MTDPYTRTAIANVHLRCERLLDAMQEALSVPLPCGMEDIDLDRDRRFLERAAARPLHDISAANALAFALDEIEATVEQVFEAAL